MQDAKYSTYDLRCRAVKALLDGVLVGDVSRAYGVDRVTVYRWRVRFEQGDDFSVLNRKAGSGRPRMTPDLSCERLTDIVLQPASKFGFETDFWTSKRLRQVIQDKFQSTMTSRTVLRRLQEAGLTYQKPEREYFELDPAKRQEWLRDVLPKIRQAVREFRAILYFQDEASISLTALLGKTWAPRGKTPKQRVTGKRGAISAMSAIQPRGQLLFTLHTQRIASDQVIHFLDQMLQHHPRRHLVVVMDQAPPHVSQKTKAYIESQRRLHVFHLPTYSPDWNPDEKVWNHLKHQELKGHQAKTKAELHTLAERKLSKMANDPELLRGIFFRCCVADFLS
jgi:transposase